jgi:hypothetical protein
MAIEELVGYALQIPKDRPLLEIGESVVGGFQVPQGVVDQNIFRVNTAIVLFSLARYMNAQTAEIQIGENGSNSAWEKSQTFVEYHSLSGWDRGDSIDWDIVEVGRIWCMLRKYEDAFVGGNPPDFADGISFGQHDDMIDTEFLERFDEFIRQIDLGLDNLYTHHNIGWERTRIKYSD